MARFKPIPTEALLWAYSHGIFPMADSRHGEIDWYSADPRAILPLESFHASHSLRQRLRRGTYEIRTDTAFAQVIERCSQPRPGHPETWINDQIIEAFTRLHQLGLAHSVEAWTKPQREGEKGELVGGLYGLALGGAFFGESMFSRATDASKVCLCHLVGHLRQRGFALLDVQMTSSHMAQFGTILIPREEYLDRLGAALELDVTW
jgi:leucyl/phenylalanyl-tRNA--protein transferase